MSVAEKDFDRWNGLKKQVQHKPSRLLYREREIWWAYLGCNVGFEEDGKGLKFLRPVVIIRGFSAQLVWVLPLSTIQKRGTYYFPFEAPNGKNNVAILSQLKALDTLRLHTKMGTMSPPQFLAMKQKLQKILD